MKRFIIGLLLLITFWGVLIYFSGILTITYRDNKNWSDNHNKYCGFLIHCQYYYELDTSGTLEILVYQPNISLDSDNYNVYNGLNCKSTGEIKSITAKFSNSNKRLSLIKENNRNNNIWEANVPKKMIDDSKNLELFISFQSSSLDEIIFLDRNIQKNYNGKDSALLLCAGSFIIFSYLLWGILILLLTFSSTHDSKFKKQVVAGIISISISFFIFKYFMLPLFDF